MVEAAEIKKTISIHLFKPFESHLYRGAIYFVAHPEIIIAEAMIAALAQDNKLLLVTPESIHLIIFKTNKNIKCDRQKFTAQLTKPTLPSI